MSGVVRYVSASGGAYVRSTPAGSQILALAFGELMYDISGVSKVTASLNGVSYVWVKVHYYQINSNNSTTTGDGWITEVNTTTVSSVHPAKVNVYYSGTNVQYKRFTNARYIYDYLHSNGWNNNSIFGALGNMEIESYINTTTVNSIGAYGLVQWYPSTKLTSWLPPGSNTSDIDNQLDRLIYESYHEIEWSTANIPSGDDILNFAQYRASSKTAAKLAEYFVRCYEKCGNYSVEVPIRAASASKWSDLILTIL